ncbi:MAG: PD-(D/E)XK nuclease family protein [Euryarchaeota archaeon]|nr:PD-(D/E)XK nuclease family protein [Euryarchaeota archaeon]
MGTVPPLSYSGFSAYEECPLRWKFRYIDKLPELPRGYFSFGRSIHSALEEFVGPLAKAAGVGIVPAGAPGTVQRTLRDFDARSGKVEPEEERTLPPPMPLPELLEIYRRVWVSDGYLSPEDEKRYFDLGADLLRRFHALFLSAPPCPIAVEQELDAQLDGIRVHGIVDRIDTTPKGALEVLDYKTSKELSWQDAKESDQLTLYQVLVERNYSRPVETLTLYHMRTLSPLRTPARGPDEVSELASRMGEVSDGIRAEVYDPRPGPYCQRCDFRARCPEWKEVPVEERARVFELVERYAELRRQGEGLRQEMEAVASELHEISEHLGVHRLSGRSGTVYRHKETPWVFPPEQVLPVLQAAGLLPRTSRVDGEQVARLLHDSKVPPEVRRTLREKGSRRAEWALRFERSGGRYRDS